MVDRPVPVLAAQAVGLACGGEKLIVVQRWTGFTGGRHALAICVNDAVTGRRVDRPEAVRADFNGAAGLLTPSLTEEAARTWLVCHGLPGTRPCDTCGAVLPLGGLFCTSCGLPHGHVTKTPVEAVFAVPTST